MKRFFLIVLVAAACTRPPTRTVEATEIRTIGNSPVSTIPVQPPPTLDDPSFTRLAPASRNTTKAAKGDAETPTQQDELSRKMNLPFAPPIAMDPVDGSKVSISSATPMFEYKDRLYYFSSTKNRQLFAANPDGYLKDKLASY